MPFSFIEIEEKKSRVIFLSFFFVALIYFLTAYLLLLVIENTFVFTSEIFFRPGLALPPLNHAFYAFLIAIIVAVFHWFFSTNNLIERLSTVIGASSIDTSDTYHQYLKNIVDEVSVAIGARPIEPLVIHSSSMNAFALEDFNRRACIGVTEGLLSRLNRSQIEAVVAHEAAHIASGDCLSTTVTCSLAEIYEEGVSRIKAALSKVRGRGSILLFFILIVLGFMSFLSSLLRLFLSRQREYRADAAAVRLTRNPLSLAEGLKLISRNWRGEGSQGERLESIFIVSPRFNKLDEQEGLFSDMFSTHPPIRRRIEILLDMAHLDEKTLEENLKNFIRVSPVAQPEVKSDEQGPHFKRWMVYDNQTWQGPFSLEDLQKAANLAPSQWVKLQEGSRVNPAYDDPDLKEIFAGSADRKEGSNCPLCNVSLREVNYEGAPVLKCSYCNGVFAEQDKVSRILIRSDYAPSEDIKRLAEEIFKSKDKVRLDKVDPKTVWNLECPKCKHKMHRQFFVYSYPVEIDRCIYCGGIWFDKQELEVLQYMYEHRERYLTSG